MSVLPFNSKSFGGGLKNDNSLSPLFIPAQPVYDDLEHRLQYHCHHHHHHGIFNHLHGKYYDSNETQEMRLQLLLALALAVVACSGRIVPLHQHRAGLGNRSDHINPTHYGSPLDCESCSPPINCRLDEDGLILDAYHCNLKTRKCTESLFMWCSPNLTRR